MHDTPRPDGRQPMLACALDYHGRGWTVIPIDHAAGNKAPPRGLQWKPYQSARPTEKELKTWFGNGRDYGLAVLCGTASGGLVIRDFDTMESYNRWAAAHPALAERLPTVATDRGRHVYFHAPAADLRYVDLGDGEYRGDNGHYCIVPPSRHPSGAIYRWLVPLPAGELPMIEDPRAAGLLDRAEGERPDDQLGRHDDDQLGQERGGLFLAQEHDHVTESNREDRENGENTEDGENGGNREDGEQQRQRRITEAIVGQSPSPSPLHCSVVSVLSVTSPDMPSDMPSDVLEAIVATVPTAPGQRNRQVFELARALKAIPRLADAPAIRLEGYVVEWHRRALPVITTPVFEETLIDFINAWPKVKFPKGEEPMTTILERARKSPLPAAASRYEQDDLRLLVALCRELQRESGDRPFYLACRTAARSLGLTNGKGEPDHVKTWRWLELLAAHRIVEEVERGDRLKRRASRYKYLGD